MSHSIGVLSVTKALAHKALGDGRVTTAAWPPRGTPVAMEVDVLEGGILSIAREHHAAWARAGGGTPAS